MSVYPAVHFSRAFLKELEQSNASHLSDAPTALVLHGNVPDLTSIDDEYIILKIAETYKVAIQPLEDGAFFPRAVQEGWARFQKPFMCILFLSHGRDDHIQCVQGKPASNFQAHHYHSIEPDILDSNATLILYACSTGNKLAPALAKIAKRTVLASKHNLDPIRTFFRSMNGHPQFLSYQGKNQLIEKFTNGGDGESIPFDYETSRILHADKTEYLIKKAIEGNPIAQYALGAFLLNITIRTDLQASKFAIKWLKKSAMLGSRAALFQLGECYWEGRGVQRSEKQALYYWECAADKLTSHLFFQGDRPYKGEAHIRLAHIYLSGLSCLQKSAKKTIYCWRQAAFYRASDAKNILAEINLSESHVSQKETLSAIRLNALSSKKNILGQYLLGIVYELGEFGQKRDLEKAKIWYERAASQGNQLAKKALNGISSGTKNNAGLGFS